MSDHESTYVPKTGIEKWLDSRLPIVRFGADYMSLPTPKNLNYWWTFGGILALCLVTQIATGIFLAMNYVPHTSMAFESVERIMRDVNGGDLIRYVHAKDFAWNSMLAGLNWTMQGTGVMDYELFLAQISRLTRTKTPYMLIEFLTENQEYEQAQRNVRAIANKIGVKIHGTQPAAA